MSEENLRGLLKTACKIRNGERVEPTLVTDYLYKTLVKGMSDKEVLDIVLADSRLKITPKKRQELLSAMHEKRL